MGASDLALFGGCPVVGERFPPYSSLGEEEALAAASVVRSGELSGYVGDAGPGFMGGRRVKALEAQAAALFGVKHCLAVNSWTSGLICAVGALGLEPGDEVITSPWTMAATATSVLHSSAVPVFADIDCRTFNLDPASVAQRITARTRAVLVPDIFGQSADIEALRRLAEDHGLRLLSDTAQAPLATRRGRLAGTMTDIGGYSLNHFKHVTCGEGGLIVTGDDAAAERMALIRNHGEVLLGRGVRPVPRHGIMGYNFRLGEIEAAIAGIQLTKIPGQVASRQAAAERLTKTLNQLRGLQTPYVDDGNTHVYYIYPLILDPLELGVSRSRVFEALTAEGVTGLFEGYQNIHRLPLFVEHLAYGSRGFPYDPGSRADPCPVAERLHEQILCLGLCTHEFGEHQTDLVAQAFAKVWDHLDELRAD
ncbi:MAG: DegT/DnrJ/EryC1/StrS family aminotransferase [Candidatus Nanopelagicales bacterium]|nr:DegT/DnrJ/EryC1/StrS family aminotransferase [Candidatus Nanopelagicales bacterium]MDZ4248957.1 DegT/DnrJ/EryC1/StrS family aminotransferase [Candidatus Nanopelagicales bacterium]